MDIDSAEDVLPVVRLTVTFANTVEELWEKFLDPIMMIQWLGNEIHTDIREGGSIRFMGQFAPTTAEIENYWSIKRIRKGRALLCSWGIMGVDSLFLLRFLDKGTHSMLEVRHGAIPDSAKDLHISEHWNLLLANFKATILLGEPAIRFDYSKYHPLRITRYDPKDVKVSLLCHVPPQIAFDVWTNPEKLTHFLGVEHPKVDRQYAGIYTWWSEGMGPILFTIMEEDKEIEFSWSYMDEPETRVNVRFDEVKGDTFVTLHHYNFKNPEDVIGYDIGWSSILAELKLVCELGASGIERIREWEQTLEPDPFFED